jgi:hypothetical protein
MLTINCQSCGAVYRLSLDLYTRKAAGFGVVVTCRRCKNEIHVEAPSVAPANASADEESVPADERPTMAPPEAAPEQAEDDDVKAKSAPPPAQATSKGTAPWPQAPLASPPAPAAAPRAESPAPPPAVGATPKAESPAPPAAAQRPEPRPMAATAKPLGKRDPGTGPFVALSPGLLGAQRPEPLHDDFEAPVDSSDFIHEPKRGASPKAPPVRRPADSRGKPPPAKSEQKAPPAKRGEPLKFKEPPKPPKQKPREPVRSDDVSDDLLSADVGFEGAPLLEPEPPRILAPTSSALAAPPPESEKKSPKPGAVVSRSVKPGSTSPPTSAARPRPSSATKSSRLLPIALVSLGAAGAFGLAFRSQVPEEVKTSATDNPPSAEDSPPGAAVQAAPTVPAVPAPTDGEPAAPPAVSTAATHTPTNTAPAATTPGATPRAPSTPSPKETSGPTPPSAATGAANPGSTAPAPGTPAPADPPKTAPEGPFNAEAARTALAGAVAQASSCRKPGDPSGVAVVTITFSPSGRVTSANIAGPPFAGTPTGGCIAATLRRARVPAFEGDMVTVKKTVEIR